MGTYLGLYSRRVVVAHDEVSNVGDEHLHGFLPLNFGGQHFRAVLPFPVVDCDGLDANVAVADEGGEFHVKHGIR